LADISTGMLMQTRYSILNRQGRFWVGLVFAFLLCGTGAASAETYHDARGDFNVNDVNRNIKVDLRLDQTSVAHGRPISVRFRIMNTGHRTVRLYPFSPEERSFQFEVLDVRGREIQSDESLSFDANDDVLENHQVDFVGDRTREIQLQPGETFERRIDLSKHYRLSVGSYRISGLFLPDARHNVILRSTNRLQLQVEKPTSLFQFEEVTHKDRMSDAPSAEETVYLFLSAEMAGRSDNYLKYIDERKFILSYDLFARQYLHASRQEQEVVLKRFADYLLSGPTDPLRRFRILRSSAETEGRYRVDVLALRSSGSYRVEYMYNYYLDRNPKGYWKISSVVAAIQSK